MTKCPGGNTIPRFPQNNSVRERMQRYKTTQKSQNFCRHPFLATGMIGQQQGFSLVELMIVASIMLILLGMGVPSFQGLQENRRLEGHALELVTDIQFIRSEAVARNRNIHLSFGTDAGGTCYLLHTGNTGGCTCDSSGFSQCSDPNNLAIKSVGLTADLGVRLQANVASMLFDSVRGTTTPTGSINFISSNGKTIRQVVNITGRARTCSPEGRVTGYQVC